MTNSQPYTFDRVVRILIGIAIFAGALWILNLLKDVLLPFCLACLLAYLLEPFVQYNRRLLKLNGRAVAIFATLLEAFLILGLLGYFLLPLIFDECRQVAILLKDYTQSDNLAILPESVRNLLKDIDYGYIASLLTRQDWINLLNSTFSFLSSGVDAIIGIISWFIVFLYLIFIMLDYDKLFIGFRNLIPPKYRATTLKIGGDIKSSMNHYFRGQALVAFIVGILFCIGFVIIDLPLAIVLGLFIGMLNLVPYLQLISIVPTTMLCLVYSANTGESFWMIFGLCMVVYAVVQVIQDMYLVPKIMGKTMGLNPALILLSLSVWGTLLGFMGLIIALPLTSLLLAYYNQYIIKAKVPEETEQSQHPDETPGV